MVEREEEEVEDEEETNALPGLLARALFGFDVEGVVVLLGAAASASFCLSVSLLLLLSAPLFESCRKCEYRRTIGRVRGSRKRGSW